MHTKEPWKVIANPIEHSKYDLHTIWADDMSVLIARTCFAPASESNALLIAQAPAMLRRLESAARWVGKLAADNDTNYIGERAHQELERINAVIAKARGK